MNKKFGKINLRGIDFSYYVEGHKGGRNLVVYKVIKENEMKEILAMNKITQNFGSWHFEREDEARKIIKENFEQLMKELPECAETPNNL